MAGKIPLSVKDGSCEGASGEWESSPGLMQHSAPAAQAVEHPSERDRLAEVSLAAATARQFWRRLPKLEANLKSRHIVARGSLPGRILKAAEALEC